MSLSTTVRALAAAGAIAAATPAAADVTLINVFEVPPGQEEAVIAAWAKARDFLQGEPGYITTHLHRALQPDARLALINIAQWESAEAFEAATTRMRKAGVFPKIQGLAFTPGLYQVIRTDADEGDE